MATKTAICRPDEQVAVAEQAVALDESAARHVDRPDPGLRLLVV